MAETNSRPGAPIFEPSSPFSARQPVIIKNLRIVSPGRIFRKPLNRLPTAHESDVAYTFLARMRTMRTCFFRRSVAVCCQSAISCVSSYCRTRRLE
jgi:hypothetical protein